MKKDVKVGISYGITEGGVGLRLRITIPPNARDVKYQNVKRKCETLGEAFVSYLANIIAEGQWGKLDATIQHLEKEGKLNLDLVKFTLERRETK